MKKVISSLICVVVSSSSFAQIWVARYNGPANDNDVAYAIAVDDSGNVYVTGKSMDLAVSYDYATIKYNSSGEEQWIARYNDLSNFDDRAHAITVDKAGNVYVTGISYGSGTDYDYATVKYNPSGDTLWVRRYNGPGNSYDAAYAIAVDGESNVYVTGQSYGSGTDYDYATIKYNSAGDTVWVSRYNGPGNNEDGACAIAIDGEGNIYVAGASYEPGTDYDYTTVKYNTSGVEQWVARYNGLANTTDGANAMVVDSAGNVYVTGASWDSVNGYDYATVKYNTLGEEQWVRRYNGPSNGDDQTHAIAIDGAGNVYVTGESEDSVIWDDYTTIKYNSSGEEQWVARYNGPGSGPDGAWAIAVDGNGDVYVTGVSWDSVNGYDYATVKYNTLGEEQWVEKYNGPINLNDGATAIAVDGEYVYVTGESQGSGNGFDYATIKYSCVGVEEESPKVQESNSLKVWPNPFVQSTIVRFEDCKLQIEDYKIQVYDMVGRLVEEANVKLEDSRFQITDCVRIGEKLAAGVYFVKLKGYGSDKSESSLSLRPAKIIKLK